MLCACSGSSTAAEGVSSTAMTDTMPMPAEQAHERLVDELQLCQQAFDAITGRSWHSSGILLAGAMAALALMLQVQATEFNAAWMTSLFGAGAVVILAVWSAFIRRERLLQKALIVRMHWLEGRLGFERQELLRGVRNEEGAGFGPIDVVTRRLLSPVDQSSVFSVTTRVAAIGWIAVVVWRWVLWAT